MKGLIVRIIILFRFTECSGPKCGPKSIANNRSVKLGRTRHYFPYVRITSYQLYVGLPQMSCKMSVFCSEKKRSKLGLYPLWNLIILIIITFVKRIQYFHYIQYIVYNYRIVLLNKRFCKFDVTLPELFYFISCLITQ